MAGASTPIAKGTWQRRSLHGWLQYSLHAQAIGQPAEAPPLVLIAYRLRQCGLRPNENAHAFRTRDRGIDEIAPQHQEVALMHRYYHRRILAPLALVNRDRIRESELVEVGKVVLGATLVEHRTDA